jgi:hypothetical protein
MLHPDHVTRFVIVPALAVFPEAMRSIAAVQLLLGTALIESRLTLLKQGWHDGEDGQGSALGLFQCEPATHHDLWLNYLAYQPALARCLCPLGPLPAERLMTDLLYACRIARLHYYRVPAPLPAADDGEGMAAYWKRYYNTAAGRGDPARFVRLFRQYVRGAEKRA